MKTLLKFKWMLVVLASLLIAGCGAPGDETYEANDFDGQMGTEEQAVTQAQKDWWKNLSQAGRNSAILSRAYQDYDAANPKDVGIQCKPWVQKVVNEASQGVATVPATVTSGVGAQYTWNASIYVQTMGKIINSVVYGDIVQMQIPQKNGGRGPHTAIVVSNDCVNITWIDSNWNGDNKVRVHTQTIAAFLTAVNNGGVQEYTVYRILGG